MNPSSINTILNRPCGSQNTHSIDVVTSTTSDCDEVLPASSEPSAIARPLILPGCQCRLNCTEKISEEIRKDINEQFWDLDFSCRRTFMLSYINVQGVKRRRPKNTDDANSEQPKEKPRTSTRIYNLRGITVCKVLFLSTLGYRNDKVLSCALSSTSILCRGSPG